MANSTLFIPDISGFTKFVKSTDIRHSKHIIEELINIIIKNGSEVFDVAEIEGDAVFFFKEKKISLDQITKTARKIFTAFHKHLSYYENGRICNCGSCLKAFDLKLKFIVHSGEISLAKYGSQKAKPYGDSVIEVHRLLKNDIGLNEYLLFSDTYLNDSDFQFDGDGAYQDSALGSIPFKYLKIDHWKIDATEVSNEVTEVNPDLTIESSIDIPLSSDALFQYISDFRYRHFWNQATRIIYDENKINAVGEDHYCIVKGKDLHFNTIKPKARPDVLTYGEVLKNPTPLKYFETNFFLTPTSIGETNLKLVMRVSVKWKFQMLLLPMIRRKMKIQARLVLNSIKESIPLHVEEITREMSA